ncbi:deoxyhypusine synthase [Candidatus Pacearchaeota archaeon]|nr:deoxyhypusine synthase [Candidatus Pacearchaeota archaeon]
MDIKKTQALEKNKINIARKNILRKSKEIEGVVIRGYNFDNGINYEEIIKSYSSTGAQASNLGKAIEIINEMIKEKAFIFLGYTSSMVSSGLRDIFRWLVKYKKINIIVTTAGGIEEDIIKCLGDFYLGNFRASGAELREKGINRIGNIYVANNRYIEFEEFVQPLLKELYEKQKQTGKIISASDLVWELGKKINNEKSICYWAWKNKIKIYCPAITDGALGDNIYFFKSKNPDFKIDISDDAVELNNSTIGLKKSGVILLGSGIIKHSILNANMFRNGADYAVYINTEQEFNASDAGALPEEAISWGKILPEARHVKVFGDATIIFPLIVAESFAKEK